MRRLVPLTLLAVIGALLSAWVGLTGYVWTDYELFNEAPFRAMADGRWDVFLATAPVEGPSLLLRAPLVLLTDRLGGGDLAIYRAVAVPALLAGVALGVVLTALRAGFARDRTASATIVLLAAANPITWRALEIGHPEELFGAVLCVGAVLLALRDRPWLAGLLLGVAIGNKAWAVLAMGPVLLALPRRRVACLTLACGVAALLFAPFVIANDGAGGVLAAGSTFTAWQPWQLWWLLGDHTDEPIRGFFTVKEDFRAAPAWFAPVSHPLIVALAVPISLAFRRARGDAGRGGHDLLLLLALLLLVRCVLDAANNVYYHLPFLMALLTWEAVTRERAPVLSLAATAAVYATTGAAGSWMSPDVTHAAYLAWSLPALAALSVAAFRRPAGVTGGAVRTAGPVPPQAAPGASDIRPTRTPDRVRALQP